jgi:hypothetical protein
MDLSVVISFEKGFLKKVLKASILLTSLNRDDSNTPALTNF